MLVDRTWTPEFGFVAAARAYIAPTLTFVFLLFVWEAATRFWQIPAWLLPSPVDIAVSTYQWAGLFPKHIYATTYVTVVGFLLAAAVGYVIAICLTASSFFMRTAYPLLLSLQSLPKIAIAPILLMWVGFGAASKIIIVFLVCFFPIVISAVSGLNAPPLALIDIARSFKTPKWRLYSKILIPYSIPYLFIGLKVSITFAVIGAVVGEFVAAKEGLGFLILNGVQQFNTPLAFAAMTVLSILTVVLYGIVAGSERLLVRWRVATA